MPAIHIRTHGGNDSITRMAVDAVMSLWSGDGDDTLSIDGVASMPAAVSKFDPGAGVNTFTVNKDKVYLDTFWEDVDDPVATLSTTVDGGGELWTNRLWQSKLMIQGNSMAKLVEDNGFENPASKLNELTIQSGSTLDITNQALVIDYTGASPLTVMRSLILSGRGGSGISPSPTWEGTGITSSVAAAYIDANRYSVGYAENSLLPLGAYSTFRGVAVDSTSILIAFTYTGDANLDGIVNNDDINLVGAFYGQTGKQWYQADFDFTGAVGNDDVTLIGAYYNPSAPPA